MGGLDQGRGAIRDVRWGSSGAGAAHARKRRDAAGGDASTAARRRRTAARRQKRAGVLQTRRGRHQDVQERTANPTVGTRSGGGEARRSHDEQPRRWNSGEDGPAARCTSAQTSDTRGPLTKRRFHGAAPKRRSGDGGTSSRRRRGPRRRRRCAD
jgi:hypothetical protein